MDAKQKKQITNVIRRGCKIRYKYLNEDGNTCALGALGLAAGMKETVLRNHNKTPSAAFPSLRGIIKAKFGLESHQINQIQEINDTNSSMSARRAAILRYLNEIRIVI